MRYIVGIVLALMVHQGWAQTLHGIVKGETAQGESETIIGATVLWMGTRMGTVTNLEGEFAIGVPPQAQAIIVAYVGYHTDTIAYTGQDHLQITLRSNTQTATVNVVGTNNGTLMSTLNPMLFQTINEKELAKAACCNLSESFETNASIDASFADAVTGTRQIRMLGLEGRYTQMMVDNVPAIRGLASTYGLTYIPGPWIKNIYIAKGVGSVTSGYESITGQINVALKNPENSEKLHLNAYVGSSGRTELNLVLRPKELFWPNSKKNKLNTLLLAHGAISTLRSDMNNDGFLDNPLFTNILLRNEWNLLTSNGFEGQYAISYLKTNTLSGVENYSKADEHRAELWGVNVTTDRYELTAKTGYVFQHKPWKSIGSQLSASWHDQQGNYGYRNYLGQQLSARVNLLYASRINSDAHKFTTGISYQYDDYTERLFLREIPPIPFHTLNLSRVEWAPGVFGEYTWNKDEKLNIIAGLRGDYHNVYGVLITPRLHARYSFTDHSSIKLISGRGFRSANVLMDNVGMLASNRDILMQGNATNGIHGLQMEEAWNSGLIYTHKFKIAYREATLSLDAYRTQFVNQVVIDMETPKEVSIYNLSGKSYSNSVQAEMHYTPLRRFDVRMAYRWLEVRQQYQHGLLDKPLVNKHRAFTNLAYETKPNTKGAQWRLDATVQWISKKRIPATTHFHDENMNAGSTYSKDYFQVNGQITYVIRKNVEVYLGGENLTDFKVHDAILSAENPSSDQFDGSLLWGPVFGRMGYIGFRWTIE